MGELNIIEGFKPLGNYKRKKQIVLAHTSRNMLDYVNSLKYRYNGNNKKLPHYIIDRDGRLFQIIPPNTYSEYMETSVLNKQSIIICLENLGWLRKNPLTSYYVNWIGDTHKDEIYERKWRGHFFWQPYTEEQYDSLCDLVNVLCEEYDIPNISIGHNVVVDKVENFKGISSKSNYNMEYTDINPSFDFEKFTKNIKK